MVQKLGARQFTGKELDEDTQLYYFGARYYDPRTSVWQSPDPILASYLLGQRSLNGIFTPTNLNLYGYSHQRPVRLTDSDGREIRLQSHDVTLGYDHAYVIIIPENQEKWANDRRFQGTLPDGRRYATLGAGPTSAPAGDPLVSGVNRERDHDRSLDIEFDARLTHPDVEAGKSTEDQLIEGMFQAQENFERSDDLEYHLFPGAPDAGEELVGTNSNGFISGLLGALGFAGVPAPIAEGDDLGNIPGWTVPAPAVNYSAQTTE